MTTPTVLRCRSYTHARRFPVVIGKVGGYALPTPLTPAQVVVLLSVSALLLSTQRVWARLPGPLDAVAALIIPVVLAWAVRHARVEGRSPWRAARGLLMYLTRPRRGTLAGRPVPRPAPRRLTGAPLILPGPCASRRG